MPLTFVPRTLMALTLVSAANVHAAGCHVRAPETPPTVVELYTSEGCSSCPPADRWLSSLPADERTLALGFHVNYWDHLGWQDRLATPATTQRQRQWRSALGAPYVYTPQVIVNGKDERGWGGRAASSLPRLSPQEVPGLVIRRRDGQAVAEVSAVPGQWIAGYWAVLEDQIRNPVTRGENAGRTLVHDHVVRLYQPVDPWSGDQKRQLTLDLGSNPVFDRTRVAFVVTTRDGLRPLQAASLICPAPDGGGLPSRR
ncbi:MAG: DUF1223 domain-containing protein [Burkholderiaceae bacterium]